MVIPNLLADTFGTPAHATKELGAFPADAIFTAPAKTQEQLKPDKINELKTFREEINNLQEKLSS